MSAITKPDWKRLDAARAKLMAASGDVVDAQAKSTTSPDGVILTCGASLKPEPVAWLWHEWLALGKLHILAGAPGQGKTTIALALMATVTIGGRWPDGSRCPAGSVLMWSGEDDPADTLLPRLLAMGADPSKVYFVTGARVGGEVVSFDPARDMAQLLAEAERIGNVRLLIVDPVVSAVAGDSHKNTEVRRALQPLVDLGAALGAAVLGISHFSKGSSGRDPTERVVGSMAFGAVARVVLCAAKVKGKDGDDDRRILVRSKSNIGPDEGGFEYGIEQIELAAHPGVHASLIQWGGSVDGTARELLAEAESDINADGDDTADVDGFLRGLLADGPMTAKAIKADADGAGYAWRTVQRSAQRIGAERRKEGMKGGWIWALTASTKAPHSREGAEDASLQMVAPLASSARSLASSSEVEVF
jgi:putative DNA primase/helicase